MTGVLEGIRIVDFTHVWQGPAATQMLADFGADVIKIEPPGKGDWSRGYGPYAKDLSLVFAGLNRNKRSLAVDLRAPGGKEIVLKLLSGADVMVHNFRPGVVERLGIDYASLESINPRLVYAWSSGWGDTGPYVESNRKGHAKMAAAVGGLFLQARPGEPPLPSTVSVDYVAGMLLSQGILLALIQRMKTGRGQQVSTDLLSAAVLAHAWKAGSILNPHFSQLGEQDLGATDAAIQNAFFTHDGVIEISPVFSSDALRDISLALGLADLSQDPRFARPADRLANRTELNAILQDRFREQTTAEWLEILDRGSVLCSEVNTPREALDDPQVRANNMIWELADAAAGKVRVLGSPIRVQQSPAQLRRNPPRLGEHTYEILEELGYTEDEIARLYEARTVVSSSVEAAI